MNSFFCRTERAARAFRGCLLALLFMLCVTGSQGQKAAELYYSIHLEPAFTESQIKFVREALLSNDPSCLIWPDAPTHRVVVRTIAPIDQAALQIWIAPSGLHVVSVDLLLPADAQERATMIMAAAGFPVYVDTGHPEQDQNNYATAKAAWIDADPERYEELIRASNGEQAMPQER